MCFKKISRLFQESFKSVSTKCQGCFMEISRMFQTCFRRASSKFHVFDSLFQDSKRLKGVVRKF